MTTKPRVQYVDLGFPPQHGERALVLIRNQGWFRTTPVVAMWSHPAGMPLFETQNTVYAPPHTDETPPVAATLKAKA